MKLILDEIKRKLPNDVKLVQDEINHIYLMYEETGQYMLIDSGNPRSLIGRDKLMSYLHSQGFELTNLETKAPEVNLFKFGETIYTCTETVKLPIKIEDINNVKHTILIDVHVVDGKVPFLFGKDTGEKWDAQLSMKKETLELQISRDKHQTFPCPTIGSHYKILLHDLKEWELPETVHLIQEECALVDKTTKDKLATLETIRKIHEVTNHKNADNLLWAFKCADMTDPDLRKNINKTVTNCKICKKFKKTFSRPKTTLPKSTEFNQIVTMDLKFFGSVPVLWLVDSCTRFIKGTVLKNKEGPTLVKAIHEHWICNFGFPSIRFWADNGTEFVNTNLAELAAKANFTVQYGPAYSPWSNGTNERNHASADIIVKKVMEQDKKIDLPKAVAMAGWTHNSNINVTGYSPLQLVTGKSVTLPGLTFSTPTTASNFDAENIKSIIMGHHNMMKEYVTAEFTNKLLQISDQRRAFYNSLKYAPGDKIYYQNKDDKAWYGPVKVISHESNSVYIIDRNILKKMNVARCMPYDE